MVNCVDLSQCHGNYTTIYYEQKNIRDKLMVI